jgi:hypothetical protein
MSNDQPEGRRPTPCPTGRWHAPPSLVIANWDLVIPAGFADRVREQCGLSECWEFAVGRDVATPRALGACAVKGATVESEYPERRRQVKRKPGEPRAPVSGRIASWARTIWAPVAREEVATDSAMRATRCKEYSDGYPAVGYGPGPARGPGSGGYSRSLPAAWKIAALSEVPHSGKTFFAPGRVGNHPWATAQKGPDARRQAEGRVRRTPGTPQRAPERANAAGGPFSAACYGRRPIVVRA